MSAWTDPDTPTDHEPYVWVYPREGGDAKRKAPKNIFTENDIYTVQLPTANGHRDLAIEHALQTIESAFCHIRRKHVCAQKALPSTARAELLVFLTALQWRTPRARDHLRSQWSPILELGDELLEKAKSWTPEQRKRAAKSNRMSLAKAGKRDSNISLEQVRRIVDHPLQTTLPALVRTQTPLLGRLNMSIFCANGDTKFITSDAPVVWFDPESHKRPPMHRSPALMYKSLEITLPLSPTRALFLSYGEFPEYLAVPDLAVHEMNRRTRAHSHENFVSQSSTAHPYWYHAGSAPE